VDLSSQPKNTTAVIPFVSALFGARWSLTELSSYLSLLVWIVHTEIAFDVMVVTGMQGVDTRLEATHGLRHLKRRTDIEGNILFDVDVIVGSTGNAPENRHAISQFLERGGIIALLGL
jgi:hypothetical protein